MFTLTHGAKAIVYFEKKILLILRDNNREIPYPNMWDNPGGGIDESETAEQAIKRELLEELNISPKIIYLGKETLDGKDASKFLVCLKEEEYYNLRLGPEGQKMQFFTLEEILKINLLPKFKKFFARNFEVLKAIVENNAEVDRSKFTFEYD